MPDIAIEAEAAQPNGKQSQKKANGYEPPNLGKAIRLPVPDFNDADRPAVCLEVDFPITPINALSNLEGNAGKPIYQMSKWWARRRSSVFRSLLIAAAVQAPEDPTQAAKRVWDHYYCNHQKAGTFKKLRVLDIFMGGGTTLVEGARLGFQMAGVDLNPIAWFVTKNELACSDPEQVKALFGQIEAQVKPLIQPFYTTTCPRGHTGRWVEVETGKPAHLDPLDLPPEDRQKYRWEGPEIIYTFWAKHGPCQARGCGHRTPIFRTPVIAEKKLTTYYIPTTCPHCGLSFNVELGETRMAPGTERVILDNEPTFTEANQAFAQGVKDYSKGSTDEKWQRVERLLGMADREPGLQCPQCGAFAGRRIKAILENHSRAKRVANLKKKDLGIEKRPVYMYLLIHPQWLEGASGLQEGSELGGYAGAAPGTTAAWFERRLEGLHFIEVRGRIRLADEEIVAEDEEQTSESEGPGEEEDAEATADRKKFGLPREIVLTDGTRLQTRTGTVPQQSHFTCQKCGKPQDILEAVKPTKHTSPVAAYALQCHCPQCKAEGYNYNGRYFKPIEPGDVKRLILAEREWVDRSETDLNDYWPRQECWDAYMMRANGGVNVGWGYTHWWKMFNSRQLLVHTQLMRAITEAPEDQWLLDIREQALGALQQYLRNQNMFAFYHLKRDCLAPALSNANYHPKQATIEVSAFSAGYGPWKTTSEGILGGLEWAHETWDSALLPEAEKAKSIRVYPGDPVRLAAADLFCGSSTDLLMLNGKLYDLVITDPPFGNNLFYADLADFFYVWMRLPLLKWYQGMPERQYFEPERTPHAIEAVDNTVEHPDDREDYEKDRFVTNGILGKVRELTGNKEIADKDPNPLYRPEPSSEFYQKTLTACWTEAGRLLKPGGLMAFTFHHSADAPWVDVLKALFNAGYILVVTYPIRSDETKGESGAFGSRKIEYDIIHVCRKRLGVPQAVSWARMRRWVKDEAARLKELLEHSHGKELSDPDLLVILRGKALEFYSRHYGQVFTGDSEVLGVREALLGINLLLEDLLAAEKGAEKMRAPEGAEPVTRLFLRIFQGRASLPRDELHKTLRGTGISQGDIEARDWIRVVGTQVHVVPLPERFQYFTVPGRTRKVLKTDLDQTHFLIGAARPGSGIKVADELNRGTFQVKRSVDALLGWYAETDPDQEVRRAAGLALGLVSHWRAKPKREPAKEQRSLFDLLEAEEG